MNTERILYGEDIQTQMRHLPYTNRYSFHKPLPFTLLNEVQPDHYLANQIKEEISFFSNQKPQQPTQRFKPESFADLYEHKRHIQTLRFTLYKDEYTQAKYKEKRKLTGKIWKEEVRKEILGNDNFSIQLSEFPSDLPPDTLEYIVWIGDNTMETNKIAQRIAVFLQLEQLSFEDIVLYERPTTSDKNEISSEFRAAYGTVDTIKHFHLLVRNTYL